MLTEYTTFEDVRAALGVSEEEIDDSTLSLPIYETLLSEDLESVNSLLLTTWDALPAEVSRSAAQKRFASLVSLYSTYAVAYRLLDSVELFGYLKVNDGRASTERVPDAFKTLRSNISSMMMRIKVLLLGALSTVDPAVVVVAATKSLFVGSAGIATDPVTNV